MGAETGAAARVLTALGVDRHRVHRAVAGALERSQVRVGGPLRLTPRAKRVIALAVAEADRLRHRRIGTEHLLLGLLREGDGIAADALQRLGVTRAQVRTQLREEGTSPPSGSGT